MGRRARKFEPEPEDRRGLGRACRRRPPAGDVALGRNPLALAAAQLFGHCRPVYSTCAWASLGPHAPCPAGVPVTLTATPRLRSTPAAVTSHVLPSAVRVTQSGFGAFAQPVATTVTSDWAPSEALALETPPSPQPASPRAAKARAAKIPEPIR